MADLTSRPFHPNPEMCCEACVFGSGEHAEWCRKHRIRQILEDVLIFGSRKLCACPTHTAIIRKGGTVICDCCGGLIYEERKGL